MIKIEQLENQNSFVILNADLKLQYKSRRKNVNITKKLFK